MQTSNDQTWVRQIKQGDEEAVQALWEMLYRDSLKLSRRHNQIDDMGYDAAIATYNKLQSRGLNQFKFKSSFRSYCWSILSRELFRLIKQSPNLTMLNENTPGSSGIVADATSETVWERMKPCIDRLPANRRQIFELIDLQNKRPDEVATQLGLRRNNVNQLASRARRALRSCLEKRGFMSSADVLAL